VRIHRNLMLAAVAGMLFSLSAATPADAGFGDAMKEKACKVSCGEAKNECVEKCSAEANGGACELTCREAKTKCVPECVKS
jgi:hypothetical protein